jgi:hypothetical protein
MSQLIITLKFNDDNEDDIILFNKMMNAQKMHEFLCNIQEHLKNKLKREELSEEVWNEFDKFREKLFNELITVNTWEM